MAWRGLHISRPAHLSLQAHQLVVAQDGGVNLSFPLEDVVLLVSLLRIERRNGKFRSW